MANAYYKCLAFINHRRGGWSETYYCYQDGLTAAVAKFKTLAKIRAALLAWPSVMVAIRVSEEGNPRNSYLENVELPGWSEDSNESDTPWQAVLLRLANQGSGYKRPVYIRGIPDAVWDTLSPDNATATKWKEQLQSKFIPSLLDGGWSVKGRQRSVGGVGKKVIADWDQGNGEHKTLVTCTALPALVPGDKIQVYKLRGFRPAPGLCVVSFANPLELTFTIQLHTPADFTYQGGAYFLVYSPVYAVIDASNIGPVVHRDVGRPFGLQRGRRRAIPR